MSVHEIYQPSFKEKFKRLLTRRNLSFLGLVGFIAVIGVTFALVQQQQDLRQRASGQVSSADVEKQVKAMATAGFYALSPQEFMLFKQSAPSGSATRAVSVQVPLSDGSTYSFSADKTMAVTKVEAGKLGQVFVRGLENAQLLSKPTPPSTQKIDSRISSQLVSSATTNVIIQFNTPYSSYYEKSQPRDATTSKDSQFRSVRDSVGRQLSSQSTIRRDLKLINGVSATIDRETLEKLNKSSEVKRIELDGTARATLDSSPGQIQADQVWSVVRNGSLITGGGQTIAIIDTGVDYTHPSLGGCLGQGCKVISGNDFVNNDNDPMDDHGHGTHVAGIAAGQGTLRGIAPDAKIMAVKVLDSGGSGSFSNIIRGIEYAVDPNGDGDTSDGAKVINMSLGGLGDPDDSMSLAVDRASQAGVTVVVAAGNAGPGASTIDSPGTARTAITVAASCKPSQIGSTCQNPIANFSSRGPLVWNGVNMQKPDVSAPGVLICAARWGFAFPSGENCIDQHIRISGTSMATPHVAGAAALILQTYPNYSPEQVKALLKSTAKNLGLSYDMQGAGEIQIKQAIPFTPTVDSQPPSLSITTDPTGANSISTQTISIASRDPNINSFDVSTNLTEISGVTVQFSKTKLSGQDSLTATITINNDVVKFGQYFKSIILSNNGVEKGVVPILLNIKPTLTFSTSFIDYGTDNPSLSSWTSESKSISVTNLRKDKTQVLSVQQPQSVPGVAYQAPPSITVPPDSTSTISTQVVVNNSQAANKMYQDKFTLSTSTMSHSIATKFVKFYIVNVTETNPSDSPNSLIVLVDQERWKYYDFTTSNPTVFYATTSGPFDLVVSYFAEKEGGNYFHQYVVKENIALTNGVANVSIGKNEATNEVKIAPKTKTGADGLGNEGTRNIVWSYLPMLEQFPIGGALVSLGNREGLEKVYTSNFSTNYRMNFEYVPTQPLLNLSVWNWGVVGLSANKTLTNQSSDMMPATINWGEIPGGNEIQPLVLSKYGMILYQSWVKFPQPVVQTVYSNGTDRTAMLYAQMAGKVFQSDGSSPAFQTKPLLRKFTLKTEKELPLPIDGTLYQDLGPTIWSGKIILNQGNINIESYNYPGYEVMWDVPILLQQDYGTRLYGNFPYTLTQNGNIIKSGMIPSFPNGETSAEALVATTPPGKYEFTTEFPYKVRNIDLVGKVLATFDTTKEDPNPPAIKRLYTFSNNKRSEVYLTNNINKIEFEPDMVGGTVKSVVMEASSDGTNYRRLSTSSASGSNYSGVIPSFSGVAKVMVRVTATDSSDNSLSYTFQLPVVAGSAPDTYIVDMNAKKIMRVAYTPGQSLTSPCQIISTQQCGGLPIISSYDALPGAQCSISGSSYAMFVKVTCGASTTPTIPTITPTKTLTPTPIKITPTSTPQPLVVSPTQSVTAKKLPCGTYGDVYPRNGSVIGDNYLTSEDVSSINQLVIGLIPMTAELKRRADVNNTTTVTVADASYVKAYINGTVATFPVCLPGKTTR